MRINTAVKAAPVYTHEGARALKLTPEQALRRSVLSCLLWEDEFYEDGKAIAKAITDTANQCKVEFVADLAIEARNVMGLRHAPLLLLLNVIERGRGDKYPDGFVADTINACIQRVDEITELVALYWKDGKKPLANQLKKGLGKAFNKFDEYQFAKYNRDAKIKIRDVMFLVHPQPADSVQAAVFKAIAEDTLKTPDTWEVALSAGADKKETFTRLITTGKMPYMALLRNLRNMAQADVDYQIVANAIEARKGAQYVFPFRYVAAAKAAPRWEDSLDKALVAASNSIPKITGKTLVIVDTSGSMYYSKVSAKSDMRRIDAGAAVAAIVRECVAGEVYVFATGSQTVELKARHGMALVEQVAEATKQTGGGGIYLSACMRQLQTVHGHNTDNIIVITDEEDCGGNDSPLKAPVFGRKANYLINVSSQQKNGIGYPQTGWTHIDGFSEGVIRFIQAVDQEQANYKLAA